MTPILLMVVAYATLMSATALLGAQLGFDVAARDAPSGAVYTWREAVEVCRAQGMDLPSAAEMVKIYCHAKLDTKRLSTRHPQADKRCHNAGVSSTFENFKEEGRYWTSSRYNESVMRYLDFHDGAVGYQENEERLNVRCIAREGGDHSAPSTDAAPYDINDVDEAGFNAIVSTIAGLYEQPLKAKGKELRIVKRWNDEEESARSWFMEENVREADQIRQIREIELVGGLARHPMLNRDAYALVVCHEIGHHLGGAPQALGYSAEGQADYFAAAKCMKRYLKATKDARVSTGALPEELGARCAASYSQKEDRDICRRNILAALFLSRWFAHTRNAAPTQLDARDDSRRDSTLLYGYPTPQCRLDTMVAGALCPIDPRIPFAEDDPRVGACTRAAGYDREARPPCWFNMEEPQPASVPGQQDQTVLRVYKFTR